MRTPMHSLTLLLPLALLACEPDPVDLDGDGVPQPQDCLDLVSGVNTNAVEVCDGIDNDCDGEIDEEVTTTWWADTDGDGYGDPEVSMEACQLPAHYAAQPDDCDDTRAASNPAADEYCNGEDDNCDGDVDEDAAVDAPLWYVDSDGDGFGDPETEAPSCEQPADRVADNSDCDDADVDANPDATEYCDGDDDNCDGLIDEDSAADAIAWYIDYDGDGFGTSTDYDYTACYPISGYVSDNTDCDNIDAAINPDADEVCDLIDNNCDGTIDEDTAIDALDWYVDTDGDGYGDGTVSSIPACEQPSGYSIWDTDCDDAAADTYPDADEYCDGTDHDCDGAVLEDDSVDALTWYADTDGDGYGDADSTTLACEQPSAYTGDATDCDDTLATTNPGAAETWYDGVDADCDEHSDYDADGDGYDSQADLPEGTDCDDAEETTNPGAPEICADGIDNNCDETPSDCVIMGTLDLAEADGVYDGVGGWSVATAGDLDGDGLPDLLIGDPQHDSATIVLGMTSTLTLSGEADGDQAGTALAAGDVDGDGNNDLLVSATHTGDLAGTTYLLYGPLTADVDLGAADAMYGGLASYDYAGSALAVADDLLVIGVYGDDTQAASAGAVYLVATGDDLSTATAWALGANAYDYAGSAVATGDLDGDGTADLAAGAPGNDDGGEEAGAVFIYRGPYSGQLAQDGELVGIAAGDYAGSAVSIVRDTNGDGYDDLLVGAPGYDGDAGLAVLFLGPVASGTMTLDDGATWFYGEGADDQAGVAVASAGDADGDGVGDLVIGAPGDDEAGWDAGAAYLVLGPASGAFDLFNADAKLLGDGASAYAGSAVAGPGDVDGAGYDDLLIGAPGTHAFGGAAYLMLSEDD